MPTGERPQSWKTYAEIDRQRRQCHYQVRLPPDLCRLVQEHQERRNLNRNETLLSILNDYFNIQPNG